MLTSLLKKIGVGKSSPPIPTDPHELAERERRALVDFLSSVDHSLVIEKTPRGATLSEDDDIIRFAVEDDLSFTITHNQGGEETDRRSGLTSEELGANLAEMLHDHLTGWTPDYHAERRARLGITN